MTQQPIQDAEASQTFEKTERSKTSKNNIGENQAFFLTTLGFIGEIFEKAY